MKKTGYFLVLIVIAIGIAGNLKICLTAYAQEQTVTIDVDPDVRQLEIGEVSQDIALIARTQQQNVAFKWELYGPGELVGDVENPGIFYVPPLKLDNSAAQQATIAVTATDEHGQTMSNKVMFTLAPSLTPTPRPTAIPTARPTSPPKPAPTTKPTPRPTATPTILSTPGLSLEEKLRQLSQTLSENIKFYEQFLVREREGEEIDEQIIPVIQDIIISLRALEALYRDSGNAAMHQRIDGVTEARQKFEQELIQRRQE